MRTSLWLKLMGIFAVIILTGVVVTFVVVNLATASQFRRFVLTGDLIQAQNLSSLLADFYTQQGDWQEVESLLTTGAAVQSEMMEGMMSHGMMMGMEHGPMGSEGMQEMFDTMRSSGPLLDRVVLVDANGTVIADSSNVLTGQRHSNQHLAAGVPVMVGGQQVATILVGSMIEPVLNPLDQDFLRSVNLAVLLAAVVVGVVALILGSVFFFHITAPVRDLTGAAEAIAAGDLSQRVTLRTGDEIGRLGRAFNTMADALDQAERLRRHMVADIAHELRTPLSLVQGSLEAILDGMYELNLENVDSVHEETLVLTRLVNDLRDLALAEAGQLRLEEEDVDMTDLITRSAERFRAQAAEQGVSLATDLSTDLPTVRGDRQRISQVLINLMSNALRYTPAGGQVVVAAQPGSAEVLVSVADTGEGIASEDLPYVFERFYRADKSRARTSGGSGLGLAISRHIVKAHGGRIWAESQMGGGATFVFTLPAGE
jgi:two-component system OmpR family sensor kinase/two-component system sensor histidine kinase BaeS